jgi:hypothetical protein
MITLNLRTSIGRSPLRLAFLLIPFLLTCFALLQNAQAVVPPPDGGYAGDNTAEGTAALFSLTGGLENTAIGFHSLHANKNGNSNTAVGWEALQNNTTSDNTAIGAGALQKNTIGVANTASGELALQNNTIGSHNTANGQGALNSNLRGNDNTATGYSALLQNTTIIGREVPISGHDNTANGSQALLQNTIGSFNTATGSDALEFNVTGSHNTANGQDALNSNSDGNNNTATGFNALVSNTHGGGNIAIGNSAGSNLTTGNDNIDIGNQGVPDEADTIRIGVEETQTATFIAGIYGETTGDAGSTVPVYVDMNGNLGTAASSERFKTEIKPMDKNSEVILALKPVTFHYKRDSKGIPQFGLVAEEVAKVNPALVVRDRNGEIYTVRYDAVNAMLLNEFLKEHKTVQEQGAIIARQQKQIEALTAGLQKVSAQVEMSRPTPQMVNNNQ